MKTTLDYVVGNTAIQIIHTGKKIRVVDVEREKVKKRFLARLILVVAVTAVLAATSFYVVRLQSYKTVLDQQIYTLQSQVENLEKENVVLEKQSKETTVDYDAIYKRAKELGMRFPTNEQIEEYTVEKSTAVRVKK
jgi:cell division protein FtsL